MPENPHVEVDEINPYQPSDQANHDSITNFPGLMETISKLAFWQRIAASGLLFLSVVMAAYTFVILALNRDDFDVGEAVGFLIYLAMCLLFVILPMVFLWKASRASYHYSRNGTLQDQTQFVNAQLRFWRSTTITGLVFVGLTMLSVMLAA